MNAEKARSNSKIHCEGVGTSDSVVIPSHNLRVFRSSDDNKIRVSETDGDRKILYIFAEHFFQHPYLEIEFVLLLGDVLCSVDSWGNLCTWHASTGKILGSFRCPECLPGTLFKLNDAEIALACQETKIIILRHAKGRCIWKAYEVSVRNINTISRLNGYGKLVAVSGVCGTVEVWDYVKDHMSQFRSGRVFNLNSMAELAVKSELQVKAEEFSVSDVEPAI